MSVHACTYAINFNLAESAIPTTPLLSDKTSPSTYGSKISDALYWLMIYMLL